MNIDISIVDTPWCGHSGGRLIGASALASNGHCQSNPTKASQWLYLPTSRCQVAPFGKCRVAALLEFIPAVEVEGAMPSFHKPATYIAVRWLGNICETPPQMQIGRMDKTEGIHEDGTGLRRVWTLPLLHVV